MPLGPGHWQVLGPGTSQEGLPCLHSPLLPAHAHPLPDWVFPSSFLAEFLRGCLDLGVLCTVCGRGEAGVRPHVISLGSSGGV